MPDPSISSPARILIVDDEPLNVDYLEQELEGRGFATVSAANGAEALERVAAAPPDLVLLDVMMPVMDGITALRMLKGDPETRLIPVVLMTALNSVDDRIRGIEAGADDFLSKPVDDRELLARINTALSLKRTIDDTVDELRSTSSYLERYGRQQREVAVLAIDWRLRDESLPDEATGFAVRRHRDEATGLVKTLGGVPADGDHALLVAIFDGPDARSRSVAAVDAALDVLARMSPSSPEVTAGAAVSSGLAEVGSTRAGERRWIYGASGIPVERASELAAEPEREGVFVADETALLVNDRFQLEHVGEGVYRVLALRVERQAGLVGPAQDRRLVTILVTDIVDSTGTAEQVGDRRWAELIAAHDEAIRGELVVFSGTEIDTTGDGFVASFESPARAIACAFAVRDRLAGLALTMRAGIHTGEVEDGNGQPRGIAIHLASRIEAKAGPGEIWVSSTTRELTSGGGFTFADRGEHTLKGVSEPRRLYAAVRGPAPV